MRVGVLLSRLGSNLVAWLLLLLVLLAVSANGATIRNVSLVDSGSERGLVLAHMSDGSWGTLCLLADLNVGDAVCAVLLGRPKATRGLARPFLGATAHRQVAAIDGCPHFAPDGTKWDLNNDCSVITGPSIPAACASRHMEVDCSTLVELRHGAGPSEGLAVVGLTGAPGSICASRVGVNEAIAICRSLGFDNPERGLPLIGRYGDPSYENATIEALTCAPGQLLAACTWRPATSPECRLPSNRLGVSCPALPVTPKPMPSPRLLCYRQQASVCFQASALSGNGSGQLELADVTSASGCNSSLWSNGTNVCLLVFTYPACSTNQSADLGTIISYHLAVNFKGETDASGNYVRPPLTFHLYCIVAKESLATGQSLAPGFTTPTTAIDGHRGGQAIIELYRDMFNGNFTDKVDGAVDIGTILYAGVILQNPEPNSWLVVNNCWAFDGPQNVTLVNNKCPTADTAVIPVNATAVAVRFQAFLFNSSSASGKIELICSTVTCRIGDPSSECSRACGTFAGLDGGADVGAGSWREHDTTPPAPLMVRRPRGPPGNSAVTGQACYGLWQTLTAAAAMSLAVNLQR